jgi:HxlR-like helix-turn-helix
VIERRQAASGRGFEYHLTDAGRELERLIMMMGAWGARWVRSRLEPEDVDVTLLTWDMHRTVRPEHFPAHRVVVGFEFTDVPQNKRRWWLVSEGDAAGPVRDRPRLHNRSANSGGPAHHDHGLDRRHPPASGPRLGRRSRRMARRICVTS